MHTKIWFESLKKKRDCLEELGVCGSIKSKWILKKGCESIERIQLAQARLQDRAYKCFSAVLHESGVCTELFKMSSYKSRAYRFPGEPFVNKANSFEAS
jgi:hypothetical protein